MPRGVRASPFDQTDIVAKASPPPFNDDDGLDKWVSCADKHKYSVRLRQVTFDANIDPTFDAAWPVFKDNKQRLVNKNKLWFDKTVARRDAVKQIIEQGGGRCNGTKQHDKRQMQEDRSITMH